LFAALESKSTSNQVGWNTIAIAGLDGYARAKATFTPMPNPYVGCAGAVLPASAQVAAGKVYYADGNGLIRTLAPGGQPEQVTTFPLSSSQQMLSFAVSPDGTQLLGSIFTLPPKPTTTGDPCANGPGAAAFGPGDFALDVYAASAGGAPRQLYHQDLGAWGGTQLSQVLFFIGWDAQGPVATYPTGWATQGGGPMHYHGIPVRVDATTGKVIRPVADQCDVWDMVQTGDFACSDKTGSISVRRPDGTEIWRVPAAPNNGFWMEYLAPDEGHVVELSGHVFARDGSAVQLPDGWGYSGWLDRSTLISWGVGSNFTYVSLSAPSTAVDIGFKGLFIGTVRP
jgi:hypothetical protein